MLVKLTERLWVAAETVRTIAAGDDVVVHMASSFRVDGFKEGGYTFKCDSRAEAAALADNLAARINEALFLTRGK